MQPMKNRANPGEDMLGGGMPSGSVAMPKSSHWFRRLLAFTGPGYMVAVGYMDPGNWATDLAGGSQFGYMLLSVILFSNLMAVVLQALSARLGIATGWDLARACRECYSRPVCIALWVACEIAIAEIVTNPAALYLVIGIIGATVMPHNLYLHSSIVQTRAYPRTDEGRRIGLR